MEKGGEGDGDIARNKRRKERARFALTKILRAAQLSFSRRFIVLGEVSDRVFSFFSLQKAPFLFPFRLASSRNVLDYYLLPGFRRQKPIGQGQLLYIPSFPSLFKEPPLLLFYFYVQFFFPLTLVFFLLFICYRHTLLGDFASLDHLYLRFIRVKNNWNERKFQENYEIYFIYVRDRCKFS